MRMILALSPTVILVIYSQLIMKWRIGMASSSLMKSMDGIDRILAYIRDPFIVSSYIAALAGSFAWMFVMERYAVSIAFPVYVGLTIAGVAVGGVIVFGEPMSTGRVLSIILILAGVIVGSQS